MKNFVISHSEKTYAIKFGGWANHLHDDLPTAIYSINTDEIILPNNLKVKDYKCLVAENRKTLKNIDSVKKFLNESSKKDFGLEWDFLINHIKEKINESVLPLLLGRPRKRTDAEQRLINKAASNGHVTAMYWIGTALKDASDDNCLLWLSMAHNSDHVAAAYEMALYLSDNGNDIEAIRCLIVAADRGCDVGFISIFDQKLLNKILKIGNLEKFEFMLDDIIDNSSISSARYFKGVLLLLQGYKERGFKMLLDFKNNPKQRPKEKNIDVVYCNQVKHAQNSIDTILETINSGADISQCFKIQTVDIFNDYNELCNAMQLLR